MKILLLVPALSSVDAQNRLEGIEKQGVECSVAGFDRRYYPGKDWGREVTSLGYVEHENYLKRLLILFKAIPSIRVLANGKHSVYTFSFDLLLIAYFALIFKRNKPKLLYDVSDIRPAFIGSGLSARILRYAETLLLKRVAVVVVTSRAYVSEYFHKIQQLHSVLFHLIENKLNPGFAPVPTECSYHNRSTKTSFTIGYFGLIRCERSLQVLINSATRFDGRIKVKIRGTFLGTESYQKQIEEHPYMSYGGPYITPDDLEAIFKEVDLSWLAHAHSAINTKWARTFRFYHASYYRCPMIAQEGSQDGLVVDELGIGMTVDIFDFNSVLDALNKLKVEDLEVWHSSLKALPDSISLITDEYKKLVDLLK